MDRLLTRSLSPTLSPPSQPGKANEWAAILSYLVPVFNKNPSERASYTATQVSNTFSKTCSLAIAMGKVIEGHGRAFQHSEYDGKLSVIPSKDNPLTAAQEQVHWNRIKESKELTKNGINLRTTSLYDLQAWRDIARKGDITGENMESSLNHYSQSSRGGSSKRDAISVEDSDDGTSSSASSSSNKLPKLTPHRPSYNQRIRKHIDDRLDALQSPRDSTINLKWDSNNQKPSRPPAGSPDIAAYISEACLDRYDSLMLAKDLGSLLMEKPMDYGIFVGTLDRGKPDKAWEYLLEVEEKDSNNESVFPFRTIINKYRKGKGAEPSSSALDQE